MELVGKPTRTRVFRAGNSQAVRIPKAFELAEGEVVIERHGSALLITSKRGRWEDFFALPPLDLELDSDELRDKRPAREVNLDIDSDAEDS